MQNIGFTELLVILAIVLVIFGAESIPKIARSIGEGIREFKKSQIDPAKEEDLK